MTRSAAIDWLLQEDNPPVRLLALTHLLHRPETDEEVKDTRSRLMEYSVTQGILAHSETFWQSGPREFWSYKGKMWNVIYLGQFLADGHDARIAGGVETLLEHQWVSDKFPCMTASLLTAFHRLGFGERPCVLEGIGTLARRVLDHGGLPCSCMNTSLLSHCYMALPKLLLCFGEVSIERRSAELDEAIAWIVQEMVDHQVHVYLPGNRKAWSAARPKSRKLADSPDGETPATWCAKVKMRFLSEYGLGPLEAKASWTRFGFPLNYNSDILEAMRALASVDAPMSEGLKSSLQIIQDKCNADGLWRLERSLNDQMWVNVEEKGEPSKWITLFALIVLDHFAR